MFRRRGLDDATRQQIMHGDSAMCVAATPAGAGPIGGTFFDFSPAGDRPPPALFFALADRATCFVAALRQTRRRAGPILTPGLLSTLLGFVLAAS